MMPLNAPEVRDFIPVFFLENGANGKKLCPFECSDFFVFFAGFWRGVRDTVSGPTKPTYRIA